ncbi:MAG: hypothetical protein LQ339_002003 [Xanthoria mediterranea]|nr:MAG: hypothetical protein LQ339_002003 [Xanthoria mediterranea]
MVLREHSRRDDASKLAGEMESLTLNGSSRHQATRDLALQRSGSHRTATSSSRSTHDHGSTHRSTRSTHDDRSSTHSHRSTHDDRSTHRDSTRSHRDSNRGHTSSRDNDSTIRAHDTHRSRTSYDDHQIVPHRSTPHHSTRHRHSPEFDDLDDLDSDDLDDLDLYDGLTCQYDALTNLAARPSRSSRAAYDVAHDEFDRDEFDRDEFDRDEFDRELERIESQISAYNRGYREAMRDGRSSRRRRASAYDASSGPSVSDNMQLLRGLDRDAIVRFANRWADRTGAPLPLDWDDITFFASLWACQSLVDDTRANRRY